MRPQQSTEKIAGIIKLQLIDARKVRIWDIINEKLEECAYHPGTPEKPFTDVKAENIKYEGSYEQIHNNAITGLFTDWKESEESPTRTLSQLAQKRYIAIFTDARHRTWGVGTPEEPLRLTYKLSAEGPNESQGVEFSLNNVSSEGIYSVETSML